MSKFSSLVLKLVLHVISLALSLVAIYLGYMVIVSFISSQMLLAVGFFSGLWITVNLMYFIVLMLNILKGKDDGKYS